MKGSKRHGKRQQANDMAFRIIEEFEELLDYHRIRVPSKDPQRSTSQVALCLPARRQAVLPVVQLEGTAYFNDLSLRQFRETMNPANYVDLLIC